MEGNKRFISVIFILTIVFAILGATFAFYSWQSDNANKTNITFTVAADYSCGADGGGNITASNLAPAPCTDTNFAIQRTITTTITNNGASPVSMDMWLKVNSIGSGLANSYNFKWALTRSSTSCSSNVINSGTFYGKGANSTVTLFTEETSSDTYYLYIWLDTAEISTTTMNQSFSMSLGGSCTNEVSEYVYTANIIDWYAEDQAFAYIGQTIDTTTITVYHDPNGASAAMSALKTATGGTVDKPFFLMHRLNGSGTVTESYVGFVITSSMVTAAISAYTTKCNNNCGVMGYSDVTECINDYHGATPGTYTIRGVNLEYSPEFGTCKEEYYDQELGDCLTPFYNSNKTILINAFGISNCVDYGYNYGYALGCDIPGLRAHVGATSGNSVGVQGDDGWLCDVLNDDGSSYCVE